MQELKIFIDRFCEVHDLLENSVDGIFYRFNEVDIVPGAVYVLGRLQMTQHLELVRSLVAENKVHIVFSNPAEGSDTMEGQFQRVGIRDLVESRKIMILTGGDGNPTYRSFKYDSFAHSICRFEENIQATSAIDGIFQTSLKPYKFLFLNGRLREHRKWMLARLRQLGLLEHSLYTCLHSSNVVRGGLKLNDNGVDLLEQIEPIHYLPPYYEVDAYQERIGAPTTENNVKFSLFKNQWGEAYIKPEPYVDTYFSLVSETVCDAQHSFRTEKIWKPILIGHPWVAIANPGFYRDLRQLGFKTFNTVIDESFDSIENTQDRLMRISQVVQDLCGSNLQEFLAACKDICKYNQQHLLEYQQQEVDNFPANFVSYLRLETT